ncbi:response regulator [Massilia sp. W12]|uniref:response regulator n=1 Tax=Massilia sp. W12 TaxID=3126507 RepID=UPI0030D1D16C
MAEKTIVLLDDDELLRELLHAELEAAGYIVVAAANSADLPQLLEDHNAALLISDLVMPDHEGMEGIFAVRQQFNIPIIAISSYEQYLRVVESIVTLTLKKPFTPQQLVQQVRRLLDS